MLLSYAYPTEDGWERVKELKEDVQDYMEFYNHRRFHETLEYKKSIGVYFDSLKVNNHDYKNLVEIRA